MGYRLKYDGFDIIKNRYHALSWIFINPVDTSKIPSGNQTWQWKIHRLWMMFPPKSPCSWCITQLAWWHRSVSSFIELDSNCSVRAKNFPPEATEFALVSEVREANSTMQFPGAQIVRLPWWPAAMGQIFRWLKRPEIVGNCAIVCMFISVINIEYNCVVFAFWIHWLNCFFLHVVSFFFAFLHSLPQIGVYCGFTPTQRNRRNDLDAFLSSVTRKRNVTWPHKCDASVMEIFHPGKTSLWGLLGDAWERIIYIYMYIYIYVCVCW